MTRLLDRLVRRFTAPGVNPSGASVLTTTYGAPGNEPILPTLVGQTQAAYASNAVVFGAILARLSLFSEASSSTATSATGSCSARTARRAVVKCCGPSSRGRARPPGSCWPG